jgi:hypothetical protein
VRAGLQHVWVGAKKRDSKSNKETGMKEVKEGSGEGAKKRDSKSNKETGMKEVKEVKEGSGECVE